MLANPPRRSSSQSATLPKAALPNTALPNTGLLKAEDEVCDRLETADRTPAAIATKICLLLAETNLATTPLELDSIISAVRDGKTGISRLDSLIVAQELPLSQLPKLIKLTTKTRARIEQVSANCEFLQQLDFLHSRLTQFLEVRSEQSNQGFRDLLSAVFHRRTA